MTPGLPRLWGQILVRRCGVLVTWLLAASLFIYTTSILLDSRHDVEQPTTDYTGIHLVETRPSPPSLASPRNSQEVELVRKEADDYMKLVNDYLGKHNLKPINSVQLTTESHYKLNIVHKKQTQDSNSTIHTESKRDGQKKKRKQADKFPDKLKLHDSGNPAIYGNFTKGNGNLYLYLKQASRLGNNLFEYAALYSLAKIQNRIPMYLANSTLVNKLFPSLSVKIGPILEHHNSIYTVKEYSGNSYDSSLLDPRIYPAKDVRVCCWLGSWKYFLPRYEAEIRKEFTINPKLLSQAQDSLHKLTKEWVVKQKVKKDPSKVTYIGVHIRRGDKTKKHLNNVGWKVSSMEYIQEAFKHYRELYDPVLFVVCTDSKDWVRENLTAPDVILSHGNALQDFALLASCNHSVITVGTFGWWAAWLAGGDVIYDVNHIRHNTPIGSFFKDEDYFLPHWKGIMADKV